MTRAYNVIDADGHILEPLTLWADYMDPKYREHAPKLIRDQDGSLNALAVSMLAQGLGQRMPRDG